MPAKMRRNEINFMKKEKESSDEWMSNLYLDMKEFNELKKLVNLKPNRKYPVSDPVARLKLVLRYLSTGQGFDESQEEMMNDTLKEILKVVSEYSEWPKDRGEWLMNAYHFQENWRASSCLGVLFPYRILLNPVPECQLKYFNRETDDYSYTTLVAVDASVRIFSIAPEDQMQKKIRAHKKHFPVYDVGPIFSFVGSDQLKARPWLRVVKKTDSEKDNLEVTRALGVVKTTEEYLYLRFAILNTVIRVTKKTDLPLMLDCIRGLHNYLFLENPKYSVCLTSVTMIHQAEVNCPPEVKLTKIRALNSDKEWMARLGMDERVFQEIFDKLRGPLSIMECNIDPVKALRFVLRFLATGEGYRPELEYLITRVGLSFHFVFTEYKTKALHQVRWTDIAVGFEKKLQIPGCVGGITAKIVQMPTDLRLGGLDMKSFTVVVFFVDADMRIFSIKMQKTMVHWVRPDSVDGMVQESLSDSQINLPSARPPKIPYAFIGGEHLKGRENLIVPSNNTRYDAAQFARGLKPAMGVEDLLTKRFGVLKKGLPRMKEVTVAIFFMVCSTLHNYLLANSPAYSQGVV